MTRPARRCGIPLVSRRPDLAADPARPWLVLTERRGVPGRAREGTSRATQREAFDDALRLARRRGDPVSAPGREMPAPPPSM